MAEKETIIPAHGGYRKLKSYQIAQLIYDITVRFVELYVDKFSRNRDQMEQAARSGVRNIAEGSQASATSKKTELKLTGVARASLEELRGDYEDFLRHKGQPLWGANHPALIRFKNRRCRTIEDVRAWLEQEKQAGLETEDCVCIANATLSLLNIGCHLLDRQMASQGKAFEKEGGFSERLYRVRKGTRDKTAE
jgi:four helix bundle suffix protein